MPRNVFYSFHYQPDSSRAAQVRNMGVIEGNPPASDHDWETVKRGGDSAIERWIDGQIAGKSCAVVLIGSSTAGRKWIKYEINKAWISGKGLLGVYIHGLKDLDGKQTTQGSNPFDAFNLNGTALSLVATTHNPPYSDSKLVYAHIRANIGEWIEDAIRIRGQYP